ncbi:hypothetical protein ASE41_29055 [Streptomyces sp. Root264]|nr:hypothetical protein ASE41_29055 [Streptomyces sp. Root264]
MVLDAFRFDGSLYAVFDTLQHLPVAGRDDLFRQTGALGIPTLLLWGDQDEVTPMAHLETARDLLKPQRHLVIPECGHMAPFERPRDVADQIVPFVAARGEGSTREQPAGQRRPGRRCGPFGLRRGDRSRTARTRRTDRRQISPCRRRPSRQRHAGPLAVP